MNDMNRYWPEVSVELGPLQLTIAHEELERYVDSLRAGGAQ